MLTPGLYPASVISMDFSKLEDYTVATYAVVMRDGVVAIKDINRISRGTGKSYMRYTIHSLSDMYAALKDPYPTRAGRNRHYKAKAQPNCGPRGNNPW